MVGPGRRAGPQRWAGGGASPFELLFEGEGRLLHVVLGTRRADHESQASVSAPAGEMHPPGFRQVRRTGWLPSVGLVCLESSRPGRKGGGQRSSVTHPAKDSAQQDRGGLRTEVIAARFQAPQPGTVLSARRNC